MGLFDNLRKTLESARSGEVDVSTLTPKQRERYEANLARIEAGKAESRQAHAETMALLDEVAASRPLRGPAGELAYGRIERPTDPDQAFALFEQGGTRALLKQQLSMSRRQFSEAASDLTSATPQGVADPDERLRIEMAERSARDAARRSYVAASHPGVVVTRIATRGKTQLDDVTAHLTAVGLSTRPDLVYGVYRVPDRISPAITPSSERGRLVEWDVVHEPVPAGAAGGPVAEVSVASLSAWDHWVRRSIGDESVIDEELGVALCDVAGVRARDSFGVARSVGIRSRSTGDETAGGFPTARVEGVHVLAARPLGEAVEGLAVAAPVDLPRNGRSGVHVEVLNWAAIALVVHPQAQRMHVIPSPCAYLPSTPQELLAMYLEVVGIRGVDCFAASVTVDGPTELAGVDRWGYGATNLGGDEMCADGKVRRRLHGATHVVVAYEDGPAYAEGRERWNRYQDDVLQASLELGTHARAPIVAVAASDIENPFLRTLARAAEVYDAIAMFGEEHEPPAYRYCLPLAPRH